MSTIHIDIAPFTRPFAERLPTRLIVLEQGLLAHLGPLLSPVLPPGPWLLVADPTTWEVAGAQVRSSLPEVDTYIVEPRPGEEAPTADEQRAAALDEYLRAGSHAAALALGAGTVNDLVKMAAHRAGIPCAAIPTAPSMNGYTSGIAALLSSGVKTTQPCRPPVACLADLDLLAGAPYRMLASGLGDLLSKPVSNADWLLARALLGASYSSEAMRLVEAGAGFLEGVAARLPERDVDAVGRLMAALCLSGLAMALAGSSSPASGGEHLISHYLDMTHYAFGESRDLHGCQVGVATLTTAALYEKFRALAPRAIDVEARVAALLPWEEYAPIVEERFGALAPAVLEHARQGYPTRGKLRARLEHLQSEWPAIAAQIAPTLRPAARIRADLRAARAPTTFAEIGVDPARARRAVLHCKDIRSRYTLLHLAWELGLLEVWTNAVLDEYRGFCRANSQQPSA